MLTADLVQVSVRAGEVRPKYIDAEFPDWLEVAGTLIQIFEANIGKARQELDSDLEEFLGDGTEFVLHRGFAKLLLDRCEFDTESQIEPTELRRQVFEAAAKAHRSAVATPFNREEVVREVTEESGIPADDFERQLYADLKDLQVLQSFRSCAPEWLLKRYNVSLAQAVLLRATSMEIRLSKQPISRYREVFRKIKFFQLLHQVEGTVSTGYTIRLDGPLSLFKSSQKYGMLMANFLPTLLHCDKWKLKATVMWGKQKTERGFSLSPRHGLLPHTRLTGQWQPEEMSWLLEQFPKLESEWTVSNDAEILDLGGNGILVPDYVFEHGPSGRRVFMEIYGYWRRGAAQSRLQMLREHGPENFILALSKDLYTGEEDFSDLPGELYVFRSVPIAREVLKILNGGGD